MRRADAPPAGWYPDPAGRSGLRWWDGLDWTDHRRAPLPTPPQEFTAIGEDAMPASPATTTTEPGPAAARRSGPTAADTTAVVAEARRAARAEIDRAVQEFSARARDARRQFEPIVSQYGERVMRGLRLMGIALVALAVLWLVFQAVGQTALLNWIGDRIDSITGATAVQPVGLGTWPGSNP